MDKELRERIADTIAISLFGTIGTVRRTDALRAADRLIRELPELQPCPFCGLSHNKCGCLRTAEPVQISERGMAIVESGLTVRQAHEIKSDYAAFFCQSGCDCSCCYGMDDCYHVTDPCNCGMAAKEHRHG